MLYFRFLDFIFRSCVFSNAAGLRAHPREERWTREPGFHRSFYEDFQDNQCFRFRLPTVTTVGNVEVLQRVFFGASRVFNYVIRLDGILFSFKGVIRRCKFAVIEQCFVWNLQWSFMMWTSNLTENRFLYTLLILLVAAFVSKCSVLPGYCSDNNSSWQKTWVNKALTELFC